MHLLLAIVVTNVWNKTRNTHTRRQHITLSDGHMVEAAESKGCIGASQQGEGIGQQGRGVGVICRVCVTLQESLRSGHCHLFFLREVTHTVILILV